MSLWQLAGTIVLLLFTTVHWVAGQDVFQPEDTICRLGLNNAAPQTNAFAGGIIWVDANTNGVKEADESAPSEIVIPVTLYWGINNLPSDNQTTGCIAFPDNNGAFRFSVLPPVGGANFFLQVDIEALLEAGFVITRFSSMNGFKAYTGSTDSFRLLRATPGNITDVKLNLGVIKIPQCTNLMDIVLSLDFASEVSGETNLYTPIKHFARAVVRGLHIGIGGTHVGVVQFSGTNSSGEVNSRLAFSLNQFLNRSQLSQAIKGLGREQLTKNTSRSLWSALHFADEELDASARSPFLPRVTIVITDGEHLDVKLGPGLEEKQYPLPLADDMKTEDNTLIFVVRLKPRIGKEAYTDNYILGKSSSNQGIASWPTETYVIPVLEDGGILGGQDYLTSALVPLLTNLCNATQLRTPIQNYFKTSQPVLSWTTVNWANTYYIQIGNSPNFTQALVYEETVLSNIRSTTVPALDDGIYWWRVRGIRVNGTSGAWSAVDSFVVDALP
ncbi:MAG: VWA domain-containing protein [Anaerolineae bacterium]|nr:VWA domain-containing protein [Anaerolineae bacterium]